MSDRVELDVRYALGHSYPETWCKGALFCPHCGKQEVWEEQGEGDYYVGASFLCIACRYNFTIQGPYESNDAYQETYWSQRYQAITESQR